MDLEDLHDWISTTADHEADFLVDQGSASSSSESFWGTSCSSSSSSSFYWSLDCFLVTAGVFREVSPLVASAFVLALLRVLTPAADFSSSTSETWVVGGVLLVVVVLERVMVGGVVVVAVARVDGRCAGPGRTSSLRWWHCREDKYVKMGKWVKGGLDCNWDIYGGRVPERVALIRSRVSKLRPCQCNPFPRIAITAQVRAYVPHIRPTRRLDCLRYKERKVAGSRKNTPQTNLRATPAA